MTFTAQEIKTIEDLKDESMAKVFGQWSSPIQKLFEKVGKKHCLYYDIKGNFKPFIWVKTVGFEHQFFLNGMYIIKPDFVPEPEPKPDIDYTEIRVQRIRGTICKLMSEMLDNPDENGIYPTSRFMWKMETFILSEVKEKQNEN